MQTTVYFSYSRPLSAMPQLEQHDTHGETEADAIGQNQRDIPEYQPIQKPEEQACRKNGIHGQRNIFGSLGSQGLHHLRQK